MEQRTQLGVVPSPIYMPLISLVDPRPKPSRLVRMKELAHHFKWIGSRCLRSPTTTSIEAMVDASDTSTIETQLLLGRTRVVTTLI